MQASVQVMEQGLADGTYIDYWQEDDHFVCIRVTSIHEISDKVWTVFKVFFQVHLNELSTLESSGCSE